MTHKESNDAHKGVKLHTDLNAELPNHGWEFLNNLEFIEATRQEVHDLLKCIDTSKATGPNGISRNLLHKTGAVIVPSLTQLINLTLYTCKMPHNWKLANVIPLF